MAKARAYRGPLQGWHYRILMNAFLVRNRRISPSMKTLHTFCRPLYVGLNPRPTLARKPLNKTVSEKNPNL